MPLFAPWLMAAARQKDLGIMVFYLVDELASGQVDK